MFRDRSPGSPLKAIDFGISVFCQPGQYVDVRAGTLIYIAPDVSCRLASDQSLVLALRLAGSVNPT
jgi:hypothetical protein